MTSGASDLPFSALYYHAAGAGTNQLILRPPARPTGQVTAERRARVRHRSATVSAWHRRWRRRTTIAPH